MYTYSNTDLKILLRQLTLLFLCGIQDLLGKAHNSTVLESVAGRIWMMENSKVCDLLVETITLGSNTASPLLFGLLGDSRKLRRILSHPQRSLYQVVFLPNRFSTFFKSSLHIRGTK